MVCSQLSSVWDDLYFWNCFFILRKIVRNESKSIEKSKLKDPIDFQTLEKLGKLRQEGILTDEEFQKQKQKILK